MLFSDNQYIPTLARILGKTLVIHFKDDKCDGWRDEIGELPIVIFIQFPWHVDTISLACWYNFLCMLTPFPLHVDTISFLHIHTISFAYWYNFLYMLIPFPFENSHHFLYAYWYHFLYAYCYHFLCKFMTFSFANLYHLLCMLIPCACIHFLQIFKTHILCNHKVSLKITCNPFNSLIRLSMCSVLIHVLKHIFPSHIHNTDRIVYMDCFKSCALITQIYKSDSQVETHASPRSLQNKSKYKEVE